MELATDAIVRDENSATYTGEAFQANQQYDVHYRCTDNGTKKFRQGSVNGYSSNASGALSVSVSNATLGVTAGGAYTLHMWVHTLPPLTFDDNGVADPAYDHNFSHVLDKGAGDKAEATITFTA